MGTVSFLRPLALLLMAGRGPPTRPPSRQPDPESRPAVVSGRVVDAGSGRPLAGVVVTPAGNASNPPLSPGQVTRQPPRMLTNASGQFVIRGLRKGSLVLTATKGGYANATHGQRRPGGSTQPIAVNAGARL